MILTFKDPGMHDTVLTATEKEVSKYLQRAAKEKEYTTCQFQLTPNGPVFLTLYRGIGSSIWQNWPLDASDRHAVCNGGFDCRCTIG
jgi:hypothetical protein